VGDGSDLQGDEVSKPYVYPEPYILTPIDVLFERSPWTLIYGCKCTPDTTCSMHGGEEEE
jgi:hypothetical protein